MGKELKNSSLLNIFLSSSSLGDGCLGALGKVGFSTSNTTFFMHAERIDSSSLYLPSFPFFVCFQIIIKKLFQLFLGNHEHSAAKQAYLLLVWKTHELGQKAEDFPVQVNNIYFCLAQGNLINECFFTFLTSFRLTWQSVTIRVRF